MLTVTGRMVVNERHSTYGSFNVGILYSSIGDFAVKYDGLDEFGEGTYSGEFVIQRTYQRTRKFLAGIIVEPVAEVDAIYLNEVEEGGQERIPPSIPDPLEEELQEVSQRNMTVSSTTHPNTDTTQLHDEATTSDVAVLFGELWPLGDIVKLDPTVGRIKLRPQCDYLKTNGYRFQSKEQVWVLNS